ncbi:hypothetical protein SAMN05443668_106208 [Cryptosporangium aurantiacum]|uniref:Uncharacterized protein n=2 Tax=Cryptosporangium aurantiacum TaxID=134849 RepID=A0A1M7R2Q3_9ACTN|nr:hypothetical protein SAMN05443668_106208 [Cryptosporangium aurantiacum]
MDRNLALARPPGVTVIADARQAGCYPGEQSIKFTTPYDNICLSRRVVYLAVRGTKALETIHGQLADRNWTAQRLDGSADRLILLRGAENAAIDSDHPLHEAEYTRDEDRLSFRFGPPTADALNDAAAWQDVTMYAFTPAYWSEQHRTTAAELGAAVRNAGADTVVAMASEETWFRN